MQQEAESSHPPSKEGFPRIAALSAAMFLAVATGYVMSLGAFTFDVVVPAFFVWALLSGLLLATATKTSTRRILLDSGATSAAFALSPFVFGTLRGLLAAQAGEIPNSAMVFGYSVINMDGGFLGSNAWFVSSLALTLFAIAYSLVLLATFGATAMTSLALRIFKFGPDNIDLTKTVLLKTGAVVVVIASGVLAVAQLSKPRDRPHEFSPAVPSSHVGALTLDGPDRGRVRGRALLTDGREFDVVVSTGIAGSLVDKAELEGLTTCDSDTDGGAQLAHRCGDKFDLEDVQMEVAAVTRAYGKRVYVLGAVKRLPKAQ